MRLLGEVLAHDARETRCAVDPARAALFHDADGRTPAWVALEWMAQCAAAHGGLVARARGEAPRPGLLLGSRRLVFRCDGFPPGRRLEVRARHGAGRASGLAFDCAVLDPDGGSPLAEGRLNVLPTGPAGAPGRGIL
jgi:predicted hotdog family 3-hydroxylacyl-ACP dehydratase